MQFKSSLAHSRHTPILGEVPKFWENKFEFKAGGVSFIGPPGDAAIPTLLRVEKIVVIYIKIKNHANKQYNDLL